MSPEMRHYSFGTFDKRAPVSQKFRNFSVLFWVPQFPLYLRNAEVLIHPFGFSYIKNILNDQIFKTTSFSGQKISRHYGETGPLLDTIGFLPTFPEEIVKTMIMMMTMMIMTMMMTM